MGQQQLSSCGNSMHLFSLTRSLFVYIQIHTFILLEHVILFLKNVSDLASWYLDCAGK